MIENTLENKAKFFALYWGQYIICNDDYIWRSNETFDTVLSIYNGDLSKWYAKLKPFQSITDEDAIEVAKILIDGNITEFEKSYFDSYRFCKVFKFGKFYLQFDTIGDCDFRITIDKENLVSTSFQLVSDSIDYLRSRGYLLPWNGLTPDEIINYGWVKIKEDKP